MPYRVTWLFEGSKQSQKYTSLIGAESKARLLRRLGCKKVKIVYPNVTKNKVKKVLDEWPDIDEALSKELIFNQSELDAMADDLQDARVLAIKMQSNGFNKEFIVQRLNEEFDPTFFIAGDTIYARNDPDYLPDRKIL